MPMTNSPALAKPGNKHDLEEGDRFTPKFDEKGLITAIAVDATSNDILMVAHMNAEALIKTVSTGQAWYWSRSRQSLWLKGETSGQIQTIRDIRVDCDQDCLVLHVDVGGDGGACHTGRHSCFYRRIDGISLDGSIRLAPVRQH
jgi:phosphoribosyl-AMP cyclohydrolase